MRENANVDTLKEYAYSVREDLLKLCPRGIHLGGSLSEVEMITALFHRTMNIDPKNPGWEDRDRFIISKGHCSTTLYLVMAQCGFFDYDDVMETYKGHETKYGGHPSKAACPQLDASTGSLGHGLSIAEGIALAGKLDGKPYRVFCLMGDGEICEGSVWEAALASPHLKLGNLVAIVDRNKLCLDGPTEEIMPLEPLNKKWTDYNWNVIEIDGNDFNQVVNALDNLPDPSGDKPTVIISNTIKGKGISFLENDPKCHHAAFNQETYEKAVEALKSAYK